MQPFILTHISFAFQDVAVLSVLPPLSHRNMKWRLSRQTFTVNYEVLVETCSFVYREVTRAGGRITTAPVKVSRFRITALKSS